MDDIELQAEVETNRIERILSIEAECHHSEKNGATQKAPPDKNRKEKSDDKGDKDEDKEDSGNGKSKDEKQEDKKEDKKEDEKPKGPPIYKKPAFIITAIIVLAVLIIGGIVAWLIVRQYASTDDAYIDGHVTQISPQVSARVTELRIDDNQFVHRGDLLIQFDPTDYQVALEEAKAQVTTAEARVTQAQAQIVSAHAAVTQSQAQQNSAQASLDKASRDLKRFEQLDDYARSRQQLDDAHTAQINGEAQLGQAKANVESAEANVKNADAGLKTAEGQLESARADQHKAEVNLGYCKIYSPIDGRVTQRTVDLGNYVTMGQALFMLVDPNVWVTANYKETQLTHMQPGQPVTIKVDAYSSHKFQGHVDSIQAGSGSRFSVLPAENATGNYVKIVQRVPVKIVFDHDANTNDAFMLSPGLSVVPHVKIR